MSEVNIKDFEEWMKKAKEEWCLKQAIAWVIDCLDKEFHVNVNERHELVTKFNVKGYRNLVNGLIRKLVELRQQYNYLVLEHQKPVHGN